MFDVVDFDDNVLGSFETWVKVETFVRKSNVPVDYVYDEELNEAYDLTQFLGAFCNACVGLGSTSMLGVSLPCDKCVGTGFNQRVAIPLLFSKEA